MRTTLRRSRLCSAPIATESEEARISVKHDTAQVLAAQNPNGAEVVRDIINGPCATKVLYAKVPLSQALQDGLNKRSTLPSKLSALTSRSSRTAST
jgi:hypothetical protein